MKAVFVFSGQGAQKVGMGQDLVAESKAAAAIFQAADATLGWSISEICFAGPEEKLTESRFCQPAIYTVSAACLAAFQERNPEITPLGTAGLSLGEFAALYASGVFNFTDGLKLVARRGELMDQACRDNPGTMASVLGGNAEIIQQVCSACDIDVANYNSPGQIVISGSKAGVSQAVSQLKEQGFRKVIPLRVAGAYHSRLMQSAGDQLAPILDETPMQAPSIPVTQNFTGTFASEVSDIKSSLVNQVAGSVRWEDCIHQLLDSREADTMIEFGPGNVLTGLVKRIAPETPIFNINSSATLVNFTDSAK